MSWPDKAAGFIPAWINTSNSTNFGMSATNFSTATNFGPATSTNLNAEPLNLGPTSTNVDGIYNAESDVGNDSIITETERAECVAIDCEMVGVGPSGKFNMLARVSIVNQNGDVLLDKFVKPYQPVTDYRTMYSGIRPDDILNGEDFNKVQQEVYSIIHGKVVIGHSVNKDLQVLLIRHPWCLIRDTAFYKPLAHIASCARTPSLKKLTKVILGIDIQTGEHNSIEDARAAMGIYNTVSESWENCLKANLTGNQ